MNKKHVTTNHNTKNTKYVVNIEVKSLILLIICQFCSSVHTLIKNSLGTTEKIAFSLTNTFLIVALGSLSTSSNFQQFPSII